MDEDSREYQAAARLAYNRLFNDNPRKGDGALVLADLERVSGFKRVPNIAGWLQKTKSTAGYEIGLHESNGAKAIFARIRNFATLSEAELLALYEIARDDDAAEDGY